MSQEKTEPDSNDLTSFERFREAMKDEAPYKDNHKLYKKAVTSNKREGMELIVELVKQAIVQKHREKPRMQLNSLRLIKESFEYFNQDFMVIVGDHILPLLSQIAHFNKESTSKDRGQLYFVQKSTSTDSQEHRYTQIIGTSFIVLVLECIKVWALWCPNTQFEETYKRLVEQGISFPEETTYFRKELLTSIDVIQQRRNEIADQKKQQATLTMSSLKLDEQALHVSRHQLEQSTHTSSSQKQRSQENNNNHEGAEEAPRQVRPAEKSEIKLDANPFVQVNRIISEIQQVKVTLVEGLSKPDPIQPSILSYLEQKFQDFKLVGSEYLKQLHENYSSIEGNEDLSGNLYNECDFSEKFLEHCSEYQRDQLTWHQFQALYADMIKKQKATGDASQTLGDFISIRMQPNMLSSENNFKSNTITVPRNFQHVSSGNSHNRVDDDAAAAAAEADEDDDDERTIPANKDYNYAAESQQGQQQLQQNRGINNQHHNLHTEIAEEDEEVKSPDNKQQPNHHQLHTRQNPSEQEHQAILSASQLSRRQEYGTFESGRRTLRDAVAESENGADKYKLSMMSRTNFSKNAVNTSNYVNNSFQNQQPQQQYSSVRPVIHKSNQKSVQGGIQVDANLEQAERERDCYRNLYEESQQIIKSLKQELSNIQIKKY